MSALEKASWLFLPFFSSLMSRKYIINQNQTLQHPEPVTHVKPTYTPLDGTQFQ
jgi:hypothetical protein